MANRFLDSAGQHYTDIGTKWNGSTPNYASIEANTGRGGNTPTIRFAAGNGFGGPSMLSVDLEGEVPGLVWGTRMAIAQLFPDQGANYNFMHFWTTLGNIQVGARVELDGTITFGRYPANMTTANNQNPVVLGTTSSARTLQLNVLRYLEVEITFSTSAGTIKVWIDGVQVMNLSGLNTSPNSGTPWCTRAGFTTNNNGSRVFVRFQDTYMHDLTGSRNNARSGDVAINALLPNSTISQQSTTVGAATAHGAVNQAASDGDTSYNSFGSAGQQDIYDVPAMAGNSATPVIAVGVLAFARKDDAGVNTGSPVARSGGTDFAGTAKPLSTSYSYVRTVVEQDPADASSLTISKVNNMQFGYLRAS